MQSDSQKDNLLADYYHTDLIMVVPPGHTSTVFLRTSLATGEQHEGKKKQLAVAPRRLCVASYAIIAQILFIRHDLHYQHSLLLYFHHAYHHRVILKSYNFL